MINKIKNIFKRRKKEIEVNIAPCLELTIPGGNYIQVENRNVFKSLCIYLGIGVVFEYDEGLYAFSDIGVFSVDISDEDYEDD